MIRSLQGPVVVQRFLRKSTPLHPVKVAATIAANSPISISVMKEHLRLLSESSPLSPMTFERIQGLRRIVYDSGDYIEGKTAFLDKRFPDFRGE